MAKDFDVERLAYDLCDGANALRLIATDLIEAGALFGEGGGLTDVQLDGYMFVLRAMADKVDTFVDCWLDERQAANKKQI